MTKKLDNASTKSAFTQQALTALTTAIRAEKQGLAAGTCINLGPDNKPVAGPTPGAE